MAKINVLDKEVAELIAAGEVVERPASVIKELVENAVDAKATVITVEIRGGGIAFMRVTDNGCGIARDDAPTAFLRHATSKIRAGSDLDAIWTLGFRGEALASISAVAKVELLTKQAEDIEGTRYSLVGAQAGILEPAGCPDGTTIMIRDLFFNTPARMKFLKKDVTEGNAVAGMVEKIALSHPEISFRFIRDGKEQLRTPGDGKLDSAIYAVFGKAFAQALLPVHYELGGITAHGFISAPQGARANRSMQNFFINGRFVKTRTAGVALDEAMKGSLMTGKFAACVLNLEMPPEVVDVNVHPAKLEVRFVQEKPVFDVVYHAVKSALSHLDAAQAIQLQPQQTQVSVDTQQKRGAFKPQTEINAKLADDRHDICGPVPFKAPASFKPSFHGGRTACDCIPEISTPTLPKWEKPRMPISSANKIPMQADDKHVRTVTQTEIESTAKMGDKPTGIYIGEIFNTYILLQQGDENLLLIDKHAAHERILYEEIRDAAEGKEAQTLLEPVLVRLDQAEYSAVLTHQEALLEAGLETEPFGHGTIMLRTLPLCMDKEDPAAVLMELAGKLVNNSLDLNTEQLDFIYANLACRAAMKGGDRRRPEELIALAERLEHDSSLRFCPHGRPVTMRIRRRDLEKQFGRIQ